MRIISGIFKGRRFHPPKNIPARPTTDVAKEGLFNIIQNNFNFSDKSFLDLFAGTGNISYEMASRGCENIICIEKHHRSAEFIKTTAEELKINIKVFQMDVFHFIKSADKKFDLIFAGPPYALIRLNALPSLIFEHNLLTEGGWLILEHNPAHQFDDKKHFHLKRNYGTTIFSIFEK